MGRYRQQQKRNKKRQRDGDVAQERLQRDRNLAAERIVLDGDCDRKAAARFAEFAGNHEAPVAKSREAPKKKQRAWPGAEPRGDHLVTEVGRGQEARPTAYEPRAALQGEE